MLIAQISDTHILPPNSDDPKSSERLHTLSAFVDHINALDERPDCVLHTGDVTHGGTPELYDIVRSVMGKLSVPVYFAVGNRDKQANLVEGLQSLGAAKMVKGHLIYAIDDFPVRLIAMDTQHHDDNIGTTCSVRLDALDGMLKEYPEKPTALFMHHPPFEVTTSKYPFQFDDQELAQKFLDLVSHHKHVVHMFCGHAHRQFNVNLGSFVASIAPSLPVDNRLGDFEEHQKNAPLYQLHRWNSDTMSFETKLCVVPA